MRAMDVFGEGRSNEVNTENMIGASPIRYFLIVYICVIRKWDEKALTVTFGRGVASFRHSISSNYSLTGVT